MDLFVLRRFHHFGGEDTGRAVQRGERLIQLRHLAADGGRLFHDVHLVARVGNVQRGLNARDAAADDQRALDDRALPGLERRVEMQFGDGGLGEDDRLFGALRHIPVDPRALLADVGDFHHVRVQARGLRRLAEGRLVHARRAGADHDAREAVFANGLADARLAAFGAHILIVCREYDARLMAGRFRHSLDVHGGRDIAAAPTDKNADFLQ